MVGCFGRENKLLIEELEHAESLDLRVVEVRQAPLSLRKLIGKVAEGERLVSTFINGDGVSYDLVLVVAPNAGGILPAAVRVLLVDAEFETG